MFGLINSLNHSKYFSGIIMILLNLGSKYISMEVSPSQDSFMTNIIIRRLLIFTVVFTATRDIWTSIILTAAFIILVSGLFNDNSNYCIIPKKLREYPSDTRKISKQEYDNAKYIVDLYQNQKNNNVSIINKVLEMKQKGIDNFKNNIKKIKNINNNFITNLNSYASSF